jgi:hypothetical protein
MRAGVRAIAGGQRQVRCVPRGRSRRSRLSKTDTEPQRALQDELAWAAATSAPWGGQSC